MLIRKVPQLFMIPLNSFYSCLYDTFLVKTIFLLDKNTKAIQGFKNALGKHL